MSKAQRLKRLVEDEREDNLSPSEGLQPSPFDRMYSQRGGSSTNFFDGSDFAVSNQSEFVCDWVVKFKPSPSAVQNVAAGEGFGMRGVVNVQYDGEQFLEYQPAASPAQAPFVLPIVGKCFQVHGRNINFRLQRIAPGADPNLPLGMEWAIVPGKVGQWYQSLFANSTLLLPGRVPIPTFATRFQILAPFNAGDSFQQLSASGLGTVSNIPSSPNNLNYLQPIHPDAAFIQYTTLLGGLDFVVGFEVIS